MGCTLKQFSTSLFISGFHGFNYVIHLYSYQINFIKQAALYTRIKLSCVILWQFMVKFKKRKYFGTSTSILNLLYILKLFAIQTVCLNYEDLSYIFSTKHKIVDGKNFNYNNTWTNCTLKRYLNISSQLILLNNIPLLCREIYSSTS